MTVCDMTAGIRVGFQTNRKMIKGMPGWTDRRVKWNSYLDLDGMLINILKSYKDKMDDPKKNEP